MQNTSLTFEDVQGPDPLEEELSKRGITVETYVSKLAEELDAEETRYFQKDGIVTDQRNVIAWGIRQKARQDLGRDLGIQRPDRLQLDTTGSLMGLAVQVAQNLSKSGNNSVKPGDQTPQKPKKQARKPRKTKQD
jgi:hypothetical protein